MAKKKVSSPANGFVRMVKDGEVIEVNPLCVEDHKRLEWKLVDEADAEPAAEADAESEED